MSRERLLLFHANLSSERLEHYAPHAELHPLPAWQQESTGRSTLEIPLPAADLAGARRIVPSLATLVPGSYAYTFSLRTQSVSAQLAMVGHTAGSEAGDASTGPSAAGVDHVSITGPAPPAAAHPAPPLATADVDTFLVSPEIGSASLRCTLQLPEAVEPSHAPCLLSVQTIGNGQRPGRLTCHGDVTIPNVPALSQMEAVPDIRARICSPTSVSMVLRHLGHPVDLPTVAGLTYHAEHDIYGVWPMTIWAASTFGCLGYLTCFDGWEPVATLLSRGIPVIASIAYEKGELAGAAMAETTGHLVAITGLSATGVRVHDPAAPTAREVPRSYNIEELAAAWLRKRRIAYVIIPGDRIVG